MELEHPPSNHASRMTPLSIENRRIAPAPDAWGSVDRKSVFSCLLPGDRRHKRITLQVLQRFHGSTMGAAKAKRCSWWRKDSLRPGSNVSASDAIRFCDEYDDSNDVDSPTQYRKMFDQVDAIVVNQGLHGDHGLEALIKSVGKSIEKPEGAMAVWLQTVPQHFPTSRLTSEEMCPGDYWARQYETTPAADGTVNASRSPLDRGIALSGAGRHPAEMDAFQCLPHRTGESAACHHIKAEQVMQRVLGPVAARRLIVVPLFELLRSRWDLRGAWYSDRSHPFTNTTEDVDRDNLVMKVAPGQRGRAILTRAQPPPGDPLAQNLARHWPGEGVDCTHFCYTPTLFAAITGLVQEGFALAAAAR